MPSQDNIVSLDNIPVKPLVPSRTEDTRGSTSYTRRPQVRPSARWETQVSYTLSKAEDLGSNMIVPVNYAEDPGRGRDPTDPAGWPIGFDPQAFRGPAAVDQRHRLVLSGVAELPWKLRLSRIATLASGRPYTALAGADSNGDGLSVNDRARRDPADPASRVTRNGGRTASIATVDVRCARRFALSGRVALELLAEAFNLLDRANFSEVNNVFGRGAFPNDPQRDSQGRDLWPPHEGLCPAAGAARGPSEARGKLR